MQSFKKAKMKQSVKIFMAAVFFILLGTAAAAVAYHSGLYGYGTGTMDYLYKGNLVYDAILHGKAYPLWDQGFFNGMQPLRYTAPLPIYMLAVCQLITGGNVLYAYPLFLGLLVFVCGMVWFLLGNARGRCLTGGFLGIVYLLLPCSLHVLLTEGDLGKVLGILVLPMLFDGMMTYYGSGRIRCLVRVMVCFALLWLCSISFAAVTMTGALVFLIFCLVFYRSLRRTLHLAMGMAFGSMWSGVWLIPALNRVYVQKHTLEELKSCFTDLSAAFNPITCVSPFFEAGIYLGLSLLLLAVFGVLFARKKSMPGFCMGLCMLLGTSSAALPFFAALPFGRQMGMLKLVPVAAAAIMTSFLLWSSLKKPFAVIVCAILLLDVIPGMYAYREMGGADAAERCEKAYLLEEAKAVTQQRLLLLDGGDAGSMAGFLLGTGKDRIAVTAGQGWADSGIASNYLQLKDALAEGYYTYIFDRAIELGNDSVLIKTAALTEEEIAEMDIAAKKIGYRIVTSSDFCRLYHMDTAERFGVVSHYPAIGIGTAAGGISLDFPAMEETKDPDLNHYTYEELAQYRLIYLNGFTYTDKYMAERLIQQLAENGVRIIILADGMPVDEDTGVQNFLGATCSDVKFSNGFPELDTKDGLLYPELFPAENRDWKTVYINGLKDVWGSFQMENHKLDFYGTVYHDNIIMIGLNLTYYYGLTHDEAVGALLSHAMNMTGADLPRRTLLPIEIVAERDFLQIEAPEDGINTTLAYQDVFKSAQQITDRNNLACVNSGRTVVTFSLPFVWEGVGVSVLGLFFAVLLCHVLKVTKNRRTIYQAVLTGVRHPSTGDLVRTGGQITPPENVPYVVESAVWYDSMGRELKEGERFRAGKNSIRITLRTLGYAKFAEDIDITLDGSPVEQKTVEQSKGRMFIEQSYEMWAIYAFEKQPDSVRTQGREPLSVCWKLAMEVKLGYLQKYSEEEEDWQICGVVEHRKGERLSYTFSYEGADKTVYRLLYILGNGTTVYSSEFTVEWNADPEEETAETECGAASAAETAAEAEGSAASAAETAAEAEGGAASERQEIPALEVTPEWTSVKDDYDYTWDDASEDLWYEALSERNEERFRNGELKEIPWEVPD